MRQTTACAECGTEPASPAARYCGSCGHPVAPGTAGPGRGDRQRSVRISGRIADADEATGPPAAPAGGWRTVWVAAGLVGALALGVVLASLAGPDDDSAWPGELVVGDAAQIAARIIETREPLLLPSEEDARVAVVAFDRADPFTQVMHADVYAPVDSGVALMAIRLVDPQLGQATAWCSSSGWFETPTGGSSRFNALGEWMTGPAPRGLDRYAARVDEAGRLVVDLSAQVPGPSRLDRVAGDNVWVDRTSGVRVWDRSPAAQILPVADPRGRHCET